MLKLRPHMTMRILTTIGLMAWNRSGTKDLDPALAALEWSKSMNKSKRKNTPSSTASVPTMRWIAASSSSLLFFCPSNSMQDASPLG